MAIDRRTVVKQEMGNGLIPNGVANRWDVQTHIESVTGAGATDAAPTVHTKSVGVSGLRYDADNNDALQAYNPDTSKWEDVGGGGAGAATGGLPSGTTIAGANGSTCVAVTPNTTYKVSMLGGGLMISAIVTVPDVGNAPDLATTTGPVPYYAALGAFQPIPGTVDSSVLFVKTVGAATHLCTGDTAPSSRTDLIFFSITAL